MQICVGTSRTVILTKHWAFKLPFTFYKKYGKYRGFWYRLLCGLKANIQEKEFNKVKYEPIELAKIYFYIPGGFLNIMRRAAAISIEDFNNIDFSLLPEIVERKRDSFGYIDKKIYAIDYA